MVDSTKGLTNSPLLLKCHNQCYSVLFACHVGKPKCQLDPFDLVGFTNLCKYLIKSKLRILDVIKYTNLLRIKSRS